MTRTSILAAALVAALAAPALAGPAATPGVDHREHRQAHRIHAGIQDGQIGLRESWRLIRGQVGIRRAERRARSDGHVGLGERVRLHRQLNRQSRRIFRAKHN
ncbi:hypothetical protein LNKW23_00580 [Paralimibaculum aggregatum]|uniref:Uncharacterized protein n=1 Tax=Paralimibaculum aggregatum TaxID=3036245 RepID=A0ABQ6LEL6_9RHOB|nr:hypothetical protein [Limibaculum sp. NKW23]GMG80846.1 hypothetical protein LNKW23_00580 [Limibaculum sp. NKW23]